jgi:myo-inositol 2-dehydrogenase / D-chiro-inositol 1-dehydrogenase
LVCLSVAVSFKSVIFLTSKTDHQKSKVGTEINLGPEMLKSYRIIKGQVNLDRFKIGLAGFGRFGRVHAEALAGLKDVEIVSICTGSKESALLAEKEKPGIPVYADYDEFLQKTAADIIDVVSPNYQHSRQAIAAMEKGKAVILEKPIATDTNDAIQMLKVQEKISAKVQVMFEYRYAPFWKSFKTALDEGLVTDPTFAKIESWRGPFRTGSHGWRYDQARVGHQLLEEAIHYFDLAIWYFGMPERVSGFTDSIRLWKEGKVSTGVITLEYKSGLKVLIEDSLNGVAGQHVMLASGQGAMIGMSYSGIESPEEVSWFRVRDKDGGYRAEVLKTPDEVEGVRVILDDFVSRLRRGEEPSVSLSDGFNALTLDLAAITAVETGAPVKPVTASH